MTPSSFLTTALVISFLFSTGALVLAVVNYRSARDINKLKTDFFAGKNGVDLEHILFSLSEHLEDLGRQQVLTQGQLELLKERFKFAVQKVGLVKFNPFAEAGGNFSFSLALLDENNNGIVLTNLHGRESNRIYSKKIMQGESDVPLTEEELQALNAAEHNTSPIKVKKTKTKAKAD